jgi:hypothetical protein
MTAVLTGPWIHGAIPIACLIAGLLCLRFWRTSRDRVYMLLAVGFWIVGVNFTVLAMVYWGWLWRR